MPGARRSLSLEYSTLPVCRCYYAASREAQAAKTYFYRFVSQLELMWDTLT